MILIFDGQIAGQSTTGENLPDGFTAIEYTGTEPVENLWFDGENIQTKPPQPSDRHYWAGLVADLRECGLLAKAYGAAKKTVKATTAWTMFMAALPSPLMIVEDLAFAIADYRAMTDVLDADDCQMILGFLHDRGFYSDALDQALA